MACPPVKGWESSSPHRSAGSTGGGRKASHEPPRMAPKHDPSKEAQVSKTRTASVDLDALLQANRKQLPGPRCTVCVALAESDAATRAKLQAALDDVMNFPAKGLGKVFTTLGYTMGPQPVKRHRRAECMKRDD